MDKPRFKVGDAVECVMSTDSQNAYRKSDQAKAKKLGKTTFVSNAAAYLRVGYPYIVRDITIDGGVRLLGFTLKVSQYELRLSTKAQVPASES